jgi:hypothetical protein
MPMGIVSDEDFEKSIAQAQVKDIKKGRGEEKKNTPDVVRETIARCAINGEGTGKEIAEVFGVSPSSVSAYKVGATSTTTYNEPDSELVDKVLGHKERISKHAVRTALRALREITPEKLSGIKARDLAAIAKDMSAVISDMEPKTQINTNNQQNVQFVFMAPRVKELSEYQTITVNE